MDKDQFRGTPNRLLPCEKDFRAEFLMLRKYTKLAKDLEAMLRGDTENQELKSKLENTKAVAHYYSQFIASKKPLFGRN